ncbi:uncharacterized protein C8R40DRAFT_1066182 [Lentinula edodes]|uniref:uncharacterized protein n=1 Tax=Lentinula edodes TaxID=5353 RepID=UPI001E8CC0F2|nr:uncharacterized protein C8R40DRAFT_1066182 [Lentinula edodes]KAH7880064.1 hypothetical protein C8R40DRAFT_1066182 [Lentinula edodes]
MTSNGGRNPNAGFNGAPPKYLNDFSKALAGEVRILLEEVGKLRDERRQLQFEIAELMAVKSKHSLGGQYAPPEWIAKQLEPPPAPQPEEAPPPAPSQPAPPGWRTVHKRPERRPKSTKAIEPQVPQAPVLPAPHPHMASGPSVPAWAQWRPNPILSPAPRQGTPAPFPGVAAPAPSSRGGLFGPPSPPPK